MTGKARISRNEVTSVIQVNSGIRMRVIPGARMLRMVTMKLNAAANEAMPRSCKLMIQKSMPWPRFCASPVRGA